MQIKTFYDVPTATFTFLVVDEINKKSAIIDSVLDYDLFAATTNTTNADKIVDYINENQLENQWILETHVHADHITAAHYLKEKVGGKIAMGSGIKTVLETWVPIFESHSDTPLDGSQYDVLFDEGDTFKIGDIEATVWHTPGHTPACASYLIENSIFVGDTVFAPNLGTARCDFPGGSAEQLFNTIKRIYTLPDDTLIYLGHDYPKPGEEPIASVTVAESKANNRMMKIDTQENEYVVKREARDATLAVPKLLFPAIQANMRNGQFGEESESGHKFVKIPVNVI